MIVHFAAPRPPEFPGGKMAKASYGGRDGEETVR